MSGRMTSKRNKDRNLAKKPTVERLAKATFGTQTFGSVKKQKPPTVTFEAKPSQPPPGVNQAAPPNLASPTRPARVDSIVGMEKTVAGHERLIE